MLLTVWSHWKHRRIKRRLSPVVSSRRVSANAHQSSSLNTTEAGHFANNEMDSHADTCCAGANWRLMNTTGQVCEVQPFLNSCDPATNVPIAQCCTVWTDVHNGGQEYLLVADQMLWFGPDLPNSLLNPNQLRANGLSVDDNPFSPDVFGISTDSTFIPFDSTGTIVHFGSRVPTPFEMSHLPVIVLTGPDWDPANIDMQSTRTREDVEMATVRSLTSGLTRRQVASNKAHRLSSRALACGESDVALSGLSPTLHEPTFLNCLISNVHVASTCRADVDKIISEKRHSEVTPESLAAKWNIGLQAAKDTLAVTTQRGIRTAVHPLSRRLRVDHLNINRPRLHGKWCLDMMASKVKSKIQNTCAAIYTNGKFTKACPLSSRAHAADSLIDFTDDVGVPEHLMTDLAGEFVGRGTKFVKEARRMRIKLYCSEKGRKNQNHHAEREIGIVKKRWMSRMRKKNVHRRLWDFGIVFETELLTRMARGKSGRTGYEEVTGNTPDISEWLDFEFHDLVWWWDTTPNHPDSKRRLGRWLGISHRVGSDLCCWIITDSGKLISSTSVEHFTQEDRIQDGMDQQVQAFNHKLDNSLNDLTSEIEPDPAFASLYWEDEEPDWHEEGVFVPPDEDCGDMAEPHVVPEVDDNAYGEFLGMELKLSSADGDQRLGRVAKRARGPEGNPIGQPHEHHLFDTREYEVEFEDGHTERYRANIIAENMFAQVNEHGFHELLFDEIIDHRTDETAIPKSEGFVTSHNGNQVPKRTTRGWEVLVQFKDGSSEWRKLSEVKESNPVELAEYSVANRIHEEPAFKWWVSHTLRKRNRIISKAKSRYWRTTHKFGIKLPHSVEEALAMEHGLPEEQKCWTKAINKEMAKAKVAWKRHDAHTPQQVRDGLAPELTGFQEIGCHIVFDVKMNLTRKARFCAGGHTTEAPSSITYSSVVSRDSVRLGMLIASLNDLELFACDLENAYLNAPCKEKIWFEGGPECGEDAGAVCVLVRALYGLKSAGNSWRTALAQALDKCGFVPTPADPDVWLRPAIKDDGTEYHEMLLVCVDDILAVSHKAKSVLEEIGEFYTIKPGSLKEPDLYLGANVEKVQLANGRMVWSTSPRDYVKNAVENVKQMLAEEGMQLRPKVKNCFPTGYKPELDVSDECTPEQVQRFQQLIGVLRWAVELGRIDIFLEVSLLSQHQASPRVGHLEMLYHIFAYLQSHKGNSGLGRIRCDPTMPVVDESAFNHDADWTDFYGNVEEELPAKMPKPKGNPVRISVFVDANHAGNVVTRRSHTGIIIFVNNAPVIFYSKRQNTVEAATFGSEFVALRIAKELVVALRCKLRMFGVPIEGPADVFCDNKGVVSNTSVPESVLAKKHNAINYHAVREAVAAGILRVGKEDGNTNLADLLTKILPASRKWSLVGCITY